MATRKARDLKQRALQFIPSEEQDSEVSLPGYDILTYPADFTLEVLVGKWNKGEIKIPPLQRKYIWNQIRASKLIESFLMGLPVPPVFFYLERGTDQLLVVDGHQRLRSIAYFFSGVFGEPSPGTQPPPFTLEGLDERSPYLRNTYQMLKDERSAGFNRLNNSVLRSFVVKQIDPADDTSIFQIFERLNTGGVILQGQEIRNCIYDGTFNDLLNELNRYDAWRKLFGSPVDKRMRDVELILRFFALFYNSKRYKKPMKKFLNDFMREHRRAADDKIAEFGTMFKRTANLVLKFLGDKPFHIHAGLNAAVYDATFRAFANHLDELDKPYITKRSLTQMQGRFKHLTTKDSQYEKLSSTGTTDEDIVSKRAKRTEEVLFGT